MLNYILLFLILALIVLGLLVYLKQIKVETLELRLVEVGKKAEQINNNAIEAIKSAKMRLPNSVMVESFNYDDPEYIKVLSDMFSRAEVRFFMEDLRYTVGRALVEANDEKLEQNAVGKLKGIELVDREMKKIVQQAAEASA